MRSQVRERFAAAGIGPDDSAFERAIWRFRQNGTPAELLATFRALYGPTMNAFEAADRNNLAEELAEEFEQLFNEQNVGSPAAAYLKVIVTKR